MEVRKAVSFEVPKDITAWVESYAVERTKYSFGQLLFLGFLAGCYTALGGIVAISVGGGQSNNPPGIAKVRCFVFREEPGAAGRALT